MQSRFDSGDLRLLLAGLYSFSIKKIGQYNRKKNWPKNINRILSYPLFYSSYYYKMLVTFSHCVQFPFFFLGGGARRGSWIILSPPNAWARVKTLELSYQMTSLVTCWQHCSHFIQMSVKPIIIDNAAEYFSTFELYLNRGKAVLPTCRNCHWSYPSLSYSFSWYSNKRKCVAQSTSWWPYRVSICVCRPWWDAICWITPLQVRECFYILGTCQLLQRWRPQLCRPWF